MGREVERELTLLFGEMILVAGFWLLVKKNGQQVTSNNQQQVTSNK